MNIPADLKYSETHEWIRLKGNTARIGITDYAQSELGDIVYVELPKVGDEFAIGDDLAMIDSAKTTVQIYAVVGLKITKVNEALGNKPELVNADPYREGYLLEVEVADPSQVEEMLDATAYGDFIKTDKAH